MRYYNMLSRCYDENHPAYKYYGGRSIKVCQLWKDDPDEFVKWCLSNGYTQELTVDRIDVDGDYTPENCRFATRIEQQRNRRSNRAVSAFGVTKVLSEWAEDARCVVDAGTLQRRLSRGWDSEKAITTRSMRDGSTAGKISEDSAVSRHTVYRRLKVGWSLERAMSQPRQKAGRKPKDAGIRPATNKKSA